MRRTAGDWIADIALFLCASGFAVLTADTVLLGEHPSPQVLFADQTAGALACAALFLRRRWPVQLAVALLVAGVFSHFVTGATIVAVFTVAAWRPVRTTAGIAGLCFAPLPVFLAGGPDPGDPATGSAITYFVLLAGAVGWGLFVRSRRQLVASLRERADRARTQARRQAREDIAREMHDVLAHRLSLLSVHAGALAFNAGASAEETRQAAGVIRDTAHQALEDLREIIGVLRASPDEPCRPQPVLTDLARLAEESRGAGMRVELAMELTAAEGDAGAALADEAPAVVGRTAYRIVQEGLTNARKHAPGSPVTVSVTGGPGKGLTVRLSNPAAGEPQAHLTEFAPWEPAAAAAQAPPEGSGAVPVDGVLVPGAGSVPGAGQGLVGLAERTRISGGRFEAGPHGGEFRLRAWIPWTARRGPLEAGVPATGSDST